MGTIPYKNKEGKRIPGVTTVLNNLGWNRDALMYWSWNEGIEGRNYRDTSQKAADAGTLAHEMIECDIKSKALPTIEDESIKDKAETCYLNFLDWKKQVKFKVIESEIHLVSETYQVGATPDCIAEINGKLSLFDWKTGGGIYPDMLAQIAAYKEVWEENADAMGYFDCPLIGGYYLLRIGKEDASWHWHHWDNLDEAWETFKYARKLHDLHKTLKKKV